MSGTLQTWHDSSYNVELALSLAQYEECPLRDGKSESCSGIALPPEPQNCCMSGCANCVWIAYAEEVAKLLNDGGQTAKKKILENVKDPNLRAFLMLELSHLFKKNP